MSLTRMYKLLASCWRHSRTPSEYYFFWPLYMKINELKFRAKDLNELRPRAPDQPADVFVMVALTTLAADVEPGLSDCQRSMPVSRFTTLILIALASVTRTQMWLWIDAELWIIISLWVFQCKYECVVVVIFCISSCEKQVYQSLTRNLIHK